MGSLGRNETALKDHKMKLLVLCFILATANAGNIAEELTAIGATTLVDFVVKAGLAETLAGEGPFTVVAPDNHAFSKLPADLVDTLMGDVELLKKVLLFHVVPGMSVMRKDIGNNMIVPFPDVNSVHIVNVYLQSKYYDGFVTVNGKIMKKPDIVADNGVIHMMSEVVYPFPTTTIAGLVSADERFSTLLAAVVAAGLADTLAGEGPFTVFAPTNDAFAKIPKEALDELLARDRETETERQRQRDRDRETETERQRDRDRETERRRDRVTETERQRQRDRDRERQRDRERDTE